MLDPKAVTKMVEDQIASMVNDQVLETFATGEWLEPIEQKIIKYSQDRILGKFANSSAIPEIANAIKSSVEELFKAGQIPGIDQYVDQTIVRQTIDQSVEALVTSAIDTLGRDPIWLEKIEHMINQAVVQRTLASISSIDIGTIIKERVDDNMQMFRKDILDNFSSTGIDDQATACQLTILDEHTVIENQLTAHSVNVVESLSVKDLVVKGSINTDNHSWSTLADTITSKTLDRINSQWKEKLVEQVKDNIRIEGIEFDRVKIGDYYVIDGNRLTDAVTETNIQKLGKLKTLQVSGDTNLYNTLLVKKDRVGINTEDPDSALSIWDEEVSVGIGKFKQQEAYIGTNRAQGLNIGVNKDAQITIDTNGITAIKKLRVGQHRVGFGIEVPNWSGTRGDIIFNSNPVPGSPFAWVCLGAFKWKTIKAVE